MSGPRRHPGEHDDYHVEPIPGLPETPPDGERILWQGGPDWRLVAAHVFHVRGVAFYLLALILWRAGVQWDAAGPGAAAATAVALLPVAGLALGLLVVLARICARTTRYTITNRRVVLRIGMALPVAMNVPFAKVAGASLRRLAHGGGDIPLQLQEGQRIPYSWLWPHARPWHLRQPQPMLRAVPQAEQVAALLAEALAEAVPVARNPVKLAAQPAQRPVSNFVDSPILSS
ncbi:photosynthetic complex putative assembly protein PuhB [Zavarzinia sp. CC-PAN008]|uniref:photosynthetic complex putative assembly protein PuhB n=1 Tax=Zavarzinia sp. CC-PAN008 TaxID=3243332 RepID=UPI003F74366D